MVAKDRAQPRGGERLAPVRPLGHHKEPGRGRLGALRQQVGLDDAGHVGVEGDPALLVALAEDPYPSPSDVDVAHLEAEHFRRAQTRVEHEPGDGPVPPGAQAGGQGLDLDPVEAPGQPPRLPHAQGGPGLGLRQVAEQAAALASRGSPRLPTFGNRVGWRRIAHAAEPEEPGDGGQPAVDGRGGVAGAAPIPD